LVTTREEAYLKNFTEIFGVSIDTISVADKEVVKDLMEKDYSPQEGVFVVKNG